MQEIEREEARRRLAVTTPPLPRAEASLKTIVPRSRMLPHLRDNGCDVRNSFERLIIPGANYAFVFLTYVSDGNRILIKKEDRSGMVKPCDSCVPFILDLSYKQRESFLYNNLHDDLFTILLYNSSKINCE